MREGIAQVVPDALGGELDGEGVVARHEVLLGVAVFVSAAAHLSAYQAPPQILLLLTVAALHALLIGECIAQRTVAAFAGQLLAGIVVVDP